MYRHRHQAIHQEHIAVTRALQHINRENKLATKLQKQLEHELVVLEERKEVSSIQYLLKDCSNMKVFEALYALLASIGVQGPISLTFNGSR